MVKLCKFKYLLFILMIVLIESSCLSGYKIRRDKEKYATEDTMWICKEMDAWIHFSESYVDYNYGEITVNNTVIPFTEGGIGNSAGFYIEVKSEGGGYEDTIMCKATPDYSQDKIEYKITYKDTKYIPESCNLLTFVKLTSLDYDNDYVNNDINLNLNADNTFTMVYKGESLTGTVTKKGTDLILASADETQVLVFTRTDSGLTYDISSSSSTYDIADGTCLSVE